MVERLQAANIVLTLPDGVTMTVGAGSTVADVAARISPRLAREAVVARYNGKLVDMGHRLEENGSLELLTLDTPEGLDVLRHTTTHVMAQAVLRLYPGTKLAIGPTIEDGFYYDLDLPVSVGPDALPAIETEMERIAKENLPIVREELPRDELVERFAAAGQQYKVEILQEIADPQASIYRQGEFVDLCRGPHLPSTGYLKAFKLLSLAGAYWRGDEKRPMLT
ncbi:MAG: TGS domain-containing protein, partial [Bacteroidota bacterium]